MNILRVGNHALPVPKRANAHDLGFDVSTVVGKTLQPGERFLFPTGFAYQFPAGHGAILKPRSGLAFTCGVAVLAGVIDGGDQGEVKVILINHGDVEVTFGAGERIAQMMFVKRVNVAEYGQELVEVDGFNTATDRGAQGFGSTGTS